MNIDEAKSAARAPRNDFAARGVDLTHSDTLELVAHQLGHHDWNTAFAAFAATAEPTTGAPAPVLRVQNGVDAVAFYAERIGFTELWEHRFEPGLPVYLRIRRDQTVLDLSEHFGDGTPGSAVCIPVKDAVALRRELLPDSALRNAPDWTTTPPAAPPSP